ncbi:MAG: hypothetical protein LBG99_00075 [Propionibacteriaceae bacterium]|jgi:hypothetical protein|nr:hypothetical protein [Propionibacteriaceae bacterium]
METSLRRLETITVPILSAIEQPRGRVRRITVAPRGVPPVDALVAFPDNPLGITLHFIGFNQAMGPWEAAKLAVWAAHSRRIIVTCELPGFSRYGQPLSTAVRQDLLDGDPSSWGLLTLSYLNAAIEAVDIDGDSTVDVLAFSTGCSLAAAVLPAVQASYEVSQVTFMEPVTLAMRSIGRLAFHNAADYVRLLKTVPPNYPSSWVRKASIQQFKEPSIRYIFPDFLASVTMLSGDDTGVRLEDLTLPTTHLVRGSVSKLCPQDSFTSLSSRLAARKIRGTTATVAGLGHQFWHCLPAVDALAKVLY